MTLAEMRSHLVEYGGECSLPAWPKRVLWGIAPTGPIHFGYFPALAMLRLFAAHGADIVLLLANQHGYLDSQKTRLDQIASRTVDYTRDLRGLGVPHTWLVETNDVYSQPDYFQGYLQWTAGMDLQKVLDCGLTTLRSGSRSQKTVADVTYSATQIYDVVALRVDCVLCGHDEAPIYRYGLPFLKALGYRDVSYAYVPMSPGRLFTEMHASDPEENKLLLRATIEEIDSAFREAPPLHRFVSNCIMPFLRDSLNAHPLVSAEEAFHAIRRF